MERPSLALWVERTCLFVGAVLVSLFVVSRLHATVAGQTDLQTFEQAVAAFEPDTKLWSDSAKTKFHQAQALANPNIMALLEIDAVDIKVPVYFDTSEVNLNLGAGLVAGAGANNLAIAAHRDSYFRGLANIKQQDTIRVRHADGYSDLYQVDQIMIVEPDDTRLLQNASESELTLITCYPFYFVGSAPQRYVVKAHLVNETSHP